MGWRLLGVCWFTRITARKALRHQRTIGLPSHVRSGLRIIKHAMPTIATVVVSMVSYH